MLILIVPDANTDGNVILFGVIHDFDESTTCVRAFVRLFVRSFAISFNILLHDQ